VLYERLDELYAFLYLFRFEADKVEGTTGKVLNGCSTEQRRTKRPIIERYMWTVVKDHGGKCAIPV
jgi:hypothetical protein